MQGRCILYDGSTYSCVNLTDSSITPLVSLGRERNSMLCIGQNNATSQGLSECANNYCIETTPDSKQRCTIIETTGLY